MCKNWFKRVEVVNIESQILSLNPDDILVLSFDKFLSEREVEDLRKRVANHDFGTHKVILTEGGAKLSILR